MATLPSSPSSKPPLRLPLALATQSPPQQFQTPPSTASTPTAPAPVGPTTSIITPEQGAQALATLQRIYAKTQVSLDALVDESHKLKDRIKLLEAQVVPADKNVATVKLLVPACAEYHQMEVCITI